MTDTPSVEELMDHIATVRDALKFFTEHTMRHYSESCEWKRQTALASLKHIEIELSRLSGNGGVAGASPSASLEEEVVCGCPACEIKRGAWTCGAAPTALEVSKWQPIATAPKDKSILVTGGTFTWDCDYPDDVPLKHVALVYWYDDGWRGDCTGQYEEYFWYSPTHWMPLPEPPSSSSAAPLGASGSPTPIDDRAVEKVASAICGVLADWLPAPLHKMAYEDMARAALQASQETER